MEARLTSKAILTPALNDAIEAASETLTLEELGGQAARKLADALGACSSFMFSFGQDRMPYGIAHAAHAMGEYVSLGYIRDDPHDRVGRRDDKRIRVASELIEREELHRTRAYREFFSHAGAEYIANCRLSELGYGEPGAVCLMMIREANQPDFSPTEVGMLSAAMPAFQAAVRRDARLRSSIPGGTMLSTLLETLAGEPLVLFDHNGYAVWSSVGARELIGMGGGPNGWPLPLREQARKLAAMSTTPELKSQRVSISVKGSSLWPISAELFVTPETLRPRYVIARLREGKQSRARLDDLAREHRLTRTEEAILGELAEGLSNKEIAEQMVMSLETARTHVHRVLQKLGVDSRIKAALLVRDE